MSKEIWKDVIGYEDVYQVSSVGRVKSLHPGKHRYGRMLCHRMSRGYPRVTLSRRGKKRHIYVHRLVAEAFLGPPPSPEYQVNHKNGDKTDPRPENLEWVTLEENVRHATEVLGVTQKGEANRSSKLTRNDTQWICRLYATSKWTLKDLGEMFGVHLATIGRIVRGDSWKHVPGPRSQKNYAVGERQGGSRLTENDVKRMRRLSATGQYTYAELGEMFGVSRSSVCLIVNRRQWRHVP